VALELFVTHGYAQVSIQNVASKVGDIFLVLAEEGSS
jgi:hypothetical protein